MIIAPIKKPSRPRPCGVTLKGNEYRIEGDTIILLIVCKGVTYEVYADYEDYPLISKYTWYKNLTTGYVQSKERFGRTINKGVYMHRLIMGAERKSLYIDHINGDKLDNRRRNLRSCSPSQNGHNKHHTANKVVGVCKVIRVDYLAQIQINNKPYRKSFKTYEEALAQRKAWEKEFNPSGLQTKP
ncbi:MAG: hypothetical protein A2031_07970 [Deltaproteobacteria bacterium RBG_19FT_COMBO_43_11]|nr:MAG: hypothetical protein A2031_07970 [Deltaproteobacteria bacterium RBG_19FT_COMBO_43_11]